MVHVAVSLIWCGYENVALVVVSITPVLQYRYSSGGEKQLYYTLRKEQFQMVL